MVIFLIVLFAVLGAMLLSGRGHFLVSGYNATADEGEGEYDEIKLGHAYGTLCLTEALFFALIAVVNHDTFAKAMAVPIIAAIVITAIYANKKCKISD